MNAQRVAGLLGLCHRAGKLRTGEDAVEQLVKRGGAQLALIDQGMAQRGRKAIRDACEYGNVPLCELPEDLLGDSIGKPGRMAACILDAGFARKLKELLIPPIGD